MNQKHILVVDDDLNMLRSMEFILEAADFKVTTGRNGKEGLEKALAARDHQAVDLLITDVQGPGLNGVQLIDELKRVNIFLLFLVITAYGDQKLKRELARRGCSHCLDKPFHDEELLHEVFRVLKDHVHRDGN